jgi:hypothetical protein
MGRQEKADPGAVHPVGFDRSTATLFQNTYINMEEFKNTANAALKAVFERSPYDQLEGLFFNWKDNYLGLITPEARLSRYLRKSLPF